MPTEMELTLEQTQQGVSYEVSVLSDIEDCHGPSDAIDNPPKATQGLSKDSCFISHGDYTHFYRLSHSELVDIEKNIRVNSFTMKMEILLEPTSNKLMFDESNANVLERFYTSAGNLVKEILLKLNLPDHRKLKDGGEVKQNEQKLHHLEEALPEAPPATATAVVRNAYTRRVAEQQEVACLMLVSMTPEIQKNLEDRPAFEILQELKTMFQQQAEQELFETVKAFHACKQEEGKSVSTYV
ncbi:hypothetical protein Tco_0007046 [Tanacetum coccineum]